MKWTAEYVDMIKKADIKIHDKHVLSVDRHGKVGSRALEKLRQAVSDKAHVDVTCLAVWQKIKRLRKRKSQKKAKQDTPEKHVQEDIPEPGRLHSRLPSPEMPTLRFKMQRERSPTPPMTSTAAILAQAPPPQPPPLAQKPMRLWVPSPPASVSSENYPPALALPARTAIPMFVKGLPARAVNKHLMGTSWDYFPPPPPPQMPQASIQVLPEPPPPQASAEDEISQYEKNRLATIARNNAMMFALGIGIPSATLPVVKRSYNKKPKVPKAERGRPRTSERTCGRVVDYTEVAENFDDNSCNSSK